MATNEQKRKHVTIKELEKRHNDLESKVDQILNLVKEAIEDAAKDDIPNQASEPEAPYVPQFKYMFVSPFQGFKLKLKAGRRTDEGYGEYRLIPPEIADFSENSPGPPGFWGTNSDEEAEIARKAAKKSHRKEFVEVTNDPTFDVRTMVVEKPGLKGRPDAQ